MDQKKFIREVNNVFYNFKFAGMHHEKFTDDENVSYWGTNNFISYIKERVGDNGLYDVGGEFLLIKSQDEVYIVECETLFCVNWYKLNRVGRCLNSNIPTSPKACAFLERLRKAIEDDIHS